MRYETMTDEQLAVERIALDFQIEALRDEKKKIQDEVDRRYVPPGPADHQIGGSNG